MSAKARWSLRNIYLYLVCLITLIMLIVAAVNTVRAVVELVYPDPGAYYYDRPIAMDDGESDAVDEEIIKEERERQEASQRRYSVLSLVTSAAMLLIAGPLYLYHWRKIETEPQEQLDGQGSAGG